MSPAEREAAIRRATPEPSWAEEEQLAQEAVNPWDTGSWAPVQDAPPDRGVDDWADGGQWDELPARRGAREAAPPPPPPPPPPVREPRYPGPPARGRVVEEDEPEDEWELEDEPVRGRSRHSEPPVREAPPWEERAPEPPPRRVARGRDEEPPEPPARRGGGAPPPAPRRSALELAGFSGRPSVDPGRTPRPPEPVQWEDEDEGFEDEPAPPMGRPPGPEAWNRRPDDRRRPAAPPVPPGRAGGPEWDDEGDDGSMPPGPAGWNQQPGDRRPDDRRRPPGPGGPEWDDEDDGGPMPPGARRQPPVRPAPPGPPGPGMGLDGGDDGPPTMVGSPPAGAEAWHRNRTDGRRPEDGPPPRPAGPRPFGVDEDDGESEVDYPAGLGRQGFADQPNGFFDDPEPEEPRQRRFAGGRGAGGRGEPQEEPEERPVQSWPVVIAQWVAGALGGAALWVGFRFLWSSLPVVAVAAAVLVTVGLVVLVRAFLRSTDMRTTLFAVLVGLLLTVSPAILTLLGR